MSDNPKTNLPDSGVYGEAADLNRLKKSLPASRAVVGQPEQSAPPMPQQSPFPQAQPMGRPDTGAAAPPGIPSVILHPSDRPEVPMTGTAMPTPQPPTPSAPDQARLAMLQMLSQSPDVSVDTRQWAQEVLRILIGGQGVVLQ